MPITHPDIADILTAAVEIPSPAARESFLEQACQGDADLKARVAELVRMHFLAGDFLESPAAHSADALFGRRSPVRIGTRIGPYKLLQEIGEGGMGVVYMAAQEHPVERRVALKVIKPGMDSRQVIARFEAERQALAMMDHPNIASVFDAGMTESGNPYFVMELINGVPITRYCDEQHLAPIERLRLFLPVCQAVQHAHQKGIIHRDLKPSNVLVAQYDDLVVPKIIDFGVAKATSRQLTDLTLFTEFGQVMGTLEYMSPEQARRNQLDVDTRTDVYSLGVILYELLTGATPFDANRFRTAAIDEILKMIGDEEPPRPSLKLSGSQALPSIAANRRLDPVRLSRFVQGDLDWIVMRSLEKDRSRRYATVASLAADVQRFLDDEPVEARPPSAVYRFQKFARRNTGVFVSVTLMAVILVLGTVISTWQAIRATHAEARAELLASLANRNAATAFQDRDRAEIERLDAVRREFTARRRQYETNLLMARDAIQRNDPATAVWRLKLELPEPGRQDVRTWGWHYLLARCNRALPTLDGHQQAVIGVAYSPDGTLLASASDDLTVRVWDVVAQSELRTLTGHEAAVIAVAFSPDGTLLASASDDETVRLWNPKTGKSLAVLRGHAGHVRAVAFSPAGDLLATGGTDTAVKLWNVAERRQIGQLRGHTREINQIVFSPDGSRLASCADDETVRIWDVDAREQAATLSDHTDHVRSIAFSPDGSVLASCGRDASIKLWNTETWIKIAELLGHTNGVNCVAFAPDGASLASVGDDRTVRFWDLATRQILSTRIGHDGRVFSVAFAPDGRSLVTAGFDQKIRFWEATDPRQTILQGHTLQASTVAFSPDGRSLVSAGLDNQIRLCDSATGREVRTLTGHQFGVMSVAFAPTGQTLASADGSGMIRLWNPDNGELRRELPAHQGAIRQIAFSADGSLLASAGDDATIRLWQMPQGAPVATLRDHSAAVKAVAFLSGNRRLISAGSDSVVRVWDLDLQRPVATLEGDGGVVSTVAASPDGSTIAAGTNEGHIRLWGTENWTPLGDLPGHSMRVKSLAFSHGGEFLVSGSHDQSIRLWDVQTGLDVATLTGHTGDVNCVALSPDDSQLATASCDATIRLWDIRTVPGGKY